MFYYGPVLTGFSLCDIIGLLCNSQNVLRRVVKGDSLNKICHCYYVVLLCNWASLSLNRIAVLLLFLKNLSMISLKINQHVLFKIKLSLTVGRNKQILYSCQFRVRLKVT